MDSRHQLFFTVADRSYFSIIKKEIHQAAVDASFTDYKVGEIDIIVAELVSNLVKHARGGFLLVKMLEDKGIELVSIDNGPGMTDVARMMQDGISTKNTLGHGLGAIQRLSDVFQVYSLKDWGTIVLSRVYKAKARNYQAPANVEVSAVLVPKPGETSCGDGMAIVVNKDQVRIMAGDGLGHGPQAEAAVKEAVNAFKACTENTCFNCLRYVHQHVKKTRGLVAYIAFIKPKENKWSLCGVGNIATAIASPSGLKSYMSYNGVVGLTIPGSLKDHEIPMEKGQVIIMCSDGIKTRWDLNKYPAILKYDLSILTAAIFKDFARKTDDMSIVAVKYNL